MTTYLLCNQDCYKTDLIPIEALCNPTWRTTLERRPPPSTWCGPWASLATSLAAPSPHTSSPSIYRKVHFRDLDPFLPIALRAPLLPFKGHWSLDLNLISFLVLCVGYRPGRLEISRFLDPISRSMCNGSGSTSGSGLTSGS
jgi:hypothetical protein